MKLFAIFQASRVVLMLLFVFVLALSGVAGQKLPLIFSASELIVLFPLVIYCLKYSTFKISAVVDVSWFRKHFVFGNKALIGHFLLDVNTKVDILLLGIFTTDKLVGIYSLAATIYEGFNQLPFIARTVYNPVITKCYYTKPKEVLERIINLGVRFNYRVFALAGVIIIIGFPLMCFIFNFDLSIADASIVFGILIAGTVLSSGYVPYQMLLSQTGFPGSQTILFFLLFATNLLLNLAFIPIFGIYGAAIATSITSVLQVFYLKFFALKIVKLEI